MLYLVGCCLLYWPPFTSFARLCGKWRSVFYRYWILRRCRRWSKGWPTKKGQIGLVSFCCKTQLQQGRLGIHQRLVHNNLLQIFWNQDGVGEHNDLRRILFAWRTETKSLQRCYRDDLDQGLRFRWSNPWCLPIRHHTRNGCLPWPKNICLWLIWKLKNDKTLQYLYELIMKSLKLILQILHAHNFSLADNFKNFFFGQSLPHTNEWLSMV